MLQIEQLDKQLTREELSVQRHKKHLLDFFMRNRTLIISIVATFFVWGLRRQGVRTLVKTLTLTLAKPGVISALLQAKKILDR